MVQAEHDSDQDGNADCDESPEFSSWRISLAFWTLLLFAAALYASVAVSPKLATWMKVRRQLVHNANQLARLESEVDYLDRLSRTLTTDGDFARQLTAATLQANPSDNSLPVPEWLLASPHERLTVDTSGTQPAVFENLTDVLATNVLLREFSLAAAAMLTVFGFTFLNDAGVACLLGPLQYLWRAFPGVVRRYRRPPSAEPPDTTHMAAADMAAPASP